MEKKLSVKKKLSPEELVQAIVEIVNDKEEVLPEQVVDLLKKNKAGRIIDIARKVIIPMSQAMFSMKEMMDEDVAVSFSSGMYLQDEPVILEYLGFEQYVVEQEEFMMRLYKKDNFVLMRNYFENIEKGTDKWIITKELENVEPQVSLHKLDNMLEAVLVLKTLGMNISVMDVVTSKFVS